MASFFVEWMNILVRWTHLLVGIGWIGTSFYFIALDLSLRKREGWREELTGTSWLVHGGGFYHVERYKVAPANLPADLKWYKWDAYSTFMSGCLLLCVQYYWNASAFLIDPQVMPLAPWQAIGLSVLSLAGGWFAYDTICKSPLGQKTAVLAVLVFAMIVLAAWGFTHVFSGRGAFIHIGAFVGTIMAINVFGVIVPNQKKVVASLMAGEAPDAALLARSKQRSVHNNYLTLPVLLMMVSNHYPVLTSNAHAPFLVAMIILVGGGIRHIINRHDAGENIRENWWVPPVVIVALVMAFALTAPEPKTGGEAASGGPAVTDGQLMAVTQKHCIMCHSPWPTHDGFEAPPKDVILTSPDNVLRFADQVKAQAVDANTMPLGNETNITDAERAILGRWIAQNRK